jgi:hypothetical protein
MRLGAEALGGPPRPPIRCVPGDFQEDPGRLVLLFPKSLADRAAVVLFGGWHAPRLGPVLGTVENAACAPRLVRSFCTALKPPASPSAARLPGGHAASGRSRPYAAPQQPQGAAHRSLSVVLQAAGDEGEGVDAATFRTAPRPSALPGHRSRARTVFVGTRLWNVASRLYRCWATTSPETPTFTVHPRTCSAIPQRTARLRTTA